MLRWTQTWPERTGEGFPEEVTFKLWEMCLCACGMQGKVLWTGGMPQNSRLGTNENLRVGHPSDGPSTGPTPSTSPRVHTEGQQCPALCKAEGPAIVRGAALPPGVLRRA